MPTFMIGHRRYEHKYLAEATVKRILNNPEYLDSGRLLDGEDGDLIRDLFESCPFYGHIKARGVIGFEVRTNYNPEYSHLTHCFWAIHPDGTASEWSQDTALGRKLSKEAQLAKAGRNAIGDAISAFRMQVFQGRREAPCSKCGETVSQGESEVHHDGDFPYAQIILHWADMGGDTTTKSAYFARPEAKAEFVQFHNALAKLTVLCKDCHKQETKRQADSYPTGPVKIHQPPEIDLFS